MLSLTETRLRSWGGTSICVWSSTCLQYDALPSELHQDRSATCWNDHGLLDKLHQNWVIIVRIQFLLLIRLYRTDISFNFKRSFFGLMWRVSPSLASLWHPKISVTSNITWKNMDKYIVITDKRGYQINTSTWINYETPNDHIKHSNIVSLILLLSFILEFFSSLLLILFLVFRWLFFTLLPNFLPCF